MESQSQPKVQHVTKASSDELLRKFAEMDSDSDAPEAASLPRKSSSKRPRLGRKKRSKKTDGKGSDNVEDEEIRPSKENIDSNINNVNVSGSLNKVERKSLLLPHQRNNRRSSSGALLRQLGISRSSHLRSCRHKSVLAAIEKTWNKAMKGASKVFMEKHFNRHRILNNDTL